MEILVWKTSFRCNECKKDIVCRLYSSEEQQLQDQVQSMVLEQFKHDHFDETHLQCDKCGKMIKRHEIADGVYTGNEMKPICADCAKKLYAQV